jgi:hypothetical protein
LRDRGTGRSLTPRPVLGLDRVLVLAPVPADLVLVGQGEEHTGLVAPVVLRRAVPVELVLVGQGDRVELMGLVALVVLRLVAQRLVDRVGLMPQVDRVVLDLPVPVVLDPVVLVDPVATDPVGPAAPVDLVQTGLVDRVGLISRVDLAVPVDLVVPVDLAVPNLTDLVDLVVPVDLAVLMSRVDLVDLVGQADSHTRRTSNTVSTTGVVLRWAAPGTCPTGSARRITGRRLRPGNTDSAGTAGLPPVLRRLSGTVHHLQVAGVGLRLPVVGTAHGTGRRATSVWHRPISGRLVTTGTTRSPCSTRYSVDGASGSSVYGSRCTDLTASTPD